MATKKSVFLSDYTVAWIEATTSKHSHDQGPKWSEAINATVEQFRFLLRESLPELNIDEWTAILNVYAGCYFPAHGIPSRIASDMMDNVGEISLEKLEQSSPDYAVLVKKIYAMSQLEQLAVLYFVQIFWSHDWNGEWPEIVTAIKKLF